MSYEFLKKMFDFFKSTNKRYFFNRVRMKNVGSSIAFSAGFVELSEDGKYIRLYIRVENNLVAWVSFIIE